MDIRQHVNLLRGRLRDCSATWGQIAESSNGALSPSWLSKFASGKMQNPCVESLVALDSALRALEDEKSDTAA